MHVPFESVSRENQQGELIANIAEITKRLAELPRLVREAEKPELIMAALASASAIFGLALTAWRIWRSFLQKKGSPPPPPKPTESSAGCLTAEATKVSEEGHHLFSSTPKSQPIKMSNQTTEAILQKPLQQIRQQQDRFSAC